MPTYLGGKTAPWKSAFPWLTAFPVTQAWGENGETGIDIGTAFHTEITSLAAGQVLGVGYYDGGGVVSVAYTWNGKAAALYYQHLDTIESDIIPGAAVKAGQKIGLSGGQLRGGSHPSLPKYSNGPHMEVGINAPYGTIWNPKHYRPNFDPADALLHLANGGGVGTIIQDIHDGVDNAFGAFGDPFGIGKIIKGIFGGGFSGWVTAWLFGQNGGATAVQITTQPGFIPVAQAIHDAETYRPIDPTAIFGSLLHDGGVFLLRFTIVVAALLILNALLFRVAQRAANATVTNINQGLQNTAGGLQAAAALSAL